MKAKILAITGMTALVALASCNEDLVTYKQNDIRVQVSKGDAWLHDFPFLLGTNQKNPPQIAIWVEDLTGNYITTIYVSHKIATESWQGSGNNRRKESLPVWCHARGIKYPDGLYLPTKDEPLADGISGATPHGNLDVKMRPVGDLKQFVMKIELNHSTDWNNNYPEDAKEEDANYSGDSGQPAIVYSAEIDLDSSRKQYTATIIGHSSPDGNNGNICPDTSALTSALNIAKEITINIQ
ncbi:MAG: DUF2271 domain-containing protein [Tannerellaceae bacterium]|nr:DUF2271 domain-containing protein [Tannerellaceae bacterium]